MRKGRGTHTPELEAWGATDPLASAEGDVVAATEVEDVTETLDELDEPVAEGS